MSDQGPVRVVLDPAGRVVDVVLADEAASMTLDQLSGALVAAFQQAQASVAYAGLPSVDRLEAASAAAQAQAERRFGEISTALYDLSRRAGEQW